MLNFEHYLKRHGETGIQALVERLERYEGIRYAAPVSLEERWNVVMAAASLQRQAA